MNRVYGQAISIPQSSIKFQSATSKSEIKRMRTIRHLFGFLIILMSMGILTIFIRSSAMDLGYKLSDARLRQNELKNTNKLLKIELAMLKDPERIKSLAFGKIGLVQPVPEQIVKLENAE